MGSLVTASDRAQPPAASGTTNHSGCRPSDRGSAARPPAGVARCSSSPASPSSPSASRCGSTRWRSSSPPALVTGPCGRHGPARGRRGARQGVHRQPLRLADLARPAGDRPARAPRAAGAGAGDHRRVRRGDPGAAARRLSRLPPGDRGARADRHRRPGADRAARCSCRWPRRRRSGRTRCRAAPGQRLRAMAAATDNVGVFFAEDIFVAIASILLIKGFLEANGIVVTPFGVSVWAIPTAVAALARPRLPAVAVRPLAQHGVIGLPALYALAGAMFAAFALLGLRDRTNPKRLRDGGVLGADRARLPRRRPDRRRRQRRHRPRARRPRGDWARWAAAARADHAATRAAAAARHGNRLFAAALIIPVVTVAGTLLLPGTGWVDPKQATLVALAAGVARRAGDLPRLAAAAPRPSRSTPAARCSTRSAGRRCCRRRSPRSARCSPSPASGRCSAERSGRCCPPASGSPRSPPIRSAWRD